MTKYRSLPNRIHQSNTDFHFSNSKIVEFLEKLGYQFTFDVDPVYGYLTILKEIKDPLGNSVYLSGSNNGWEDIDKIFEEILLQNLFLIITKKQDQLPLELL